MATDNKNVDLLQRFIENERNAKRWTIMSVCLFCLLAFGIIILAGKLKKQKDENATLRLELALAKADLDNDSLASQNKKLANRDANYDSLQEITNSLLINMAELNKEEPGKNIISKDTAIINKATQEKIQKLITPASIKEIKEKEAKYTVYIQFTQDYTGMAKKLQRDWQNKYICPQPELIRNNSFNLSVRYFHDADRQEALKLANLVGREMGLPVKVSYVKMKTPKKQLELWLGKYKPKTTEQIFEKYDVQQVMLEQKKQ